MRSLAASAAALALVAPLLAQQSPKSPAELPPLPQGMQRYYDAARIFRVDLPAGWRQLAPGEMRRLEAAVPSLPHDLRHNEPTMYFAIGPVERWLQGDFDGAYLYVVYQDNEWQIEGDLATELQQRWAAKGAHEGIRYEIRQVERIALGADPRPVITCLRTATPSGGAPQQSLDVYAPTGGMQVTLSFTCNASDFAAREASFRAMAQSIAFARRAHGERTTTDRLWSPIVVGALVGIVLVVLYRVRRRL